MKKNILIIGGNGYLGKNLTKYAKDLGHCVTVVSREKNKVANKSIKINLAENTFVINGSYDLIIHAAGASKNNKRIDEYLEGNVVLTRNLLDSIKNCEFKNFIYISAISLYNNADDKELNENTKIINPDLYSQTKLLSESLIKETLKGSIILRIPGVVGRNAPTSWPVRLNQQFKLKERIQLFNPYDLYNHCIHMDSLAESIFKEIFFKELCDNVYLMAANNPIRIVDVAKIISGSDQEEFDLFSSNRKSTTINSKKAIDNLEYRPWSVEETLKKFKDDNA